MSAMTVIPFDADERRADQLIAGQVAKGQSPIADQQAEDYLIGCTLRSGLRPATRNVLPHGEAFSSAFNARTWDRILEAFDLVGKVDMVHVAALMRDQNRDIDAEELVTRVRGRYRDLMDNVAFPTERVLVEMAEAVRQAWVRRRAARELVVLESMAYDRTVPLAELLSRATENLQALREESVVVSHEGDRMALIQELVAATRAKPSELLTGFPSLDDWLLGLQTGQTTLIGALTSVGKSVLGMQIALNVARSGRGVYYVSLETTRRGLAERATSNLARVSTRWVSLHQRGQLSVTDFHRAQSGAAQFFQLPWVTRDTLGTAEELYAQAKSTAAHFKAKGTPMGLVVIDHLGLVKASKGHRGERRDVLARVSQAMRTIAVECDCHVIGLAQLNRTAHDAEKLPTKHQFKDSSDLEQGADNVVLIHRPDLPGGKQADEATIILDKNRMAGVRGSFRAKAEMWCATFTEVQP